MVFHCEYLFVHMWKEYYTPWNPSQPQLSILHFFCILDALCIPFFFTQLVALIYHSITVQVFLHIFNVSCLVYFTVY